MEIVAHAWKIREGGTCRHDKSHTLVVSHTCTRYVVPPNADCLDL